MIASVKASDVRLSLMKPRFSVSPYRRVERVEDRFDARVRAPDRQRHADAEGDTEPGFAALRDAGDLVAQDVGGAAGQESLDRRQMLDDRAGVRRQA